MPLEQLRRQTQLQADLADLILVERAERLDNTAFLQQLLYTGDAVMMRLNSLGALSTARFDGIGIDSSLAQNPMPVQQAMRFDDPLLLLQELLADDVPLALRIAYARQRRQEAILRPVDLDSSAAERVESGAHEIGLPFAHQAGIDVDAAHPRTAECAQTYCIGDRRVHSAADKEEDITVAYHPTDVLFNGWNAMFGVPIALASDVPEQEIRINLQAPVSVDHFGVKLDSVQTAYRFGHGSDRAGAGRAQGGKTARQTLHDVAVAHPDLLVRGEISK